MTYHLAQINIAKMRAPADSSVMREFFEALDTINALAEASDGFVWRLQDDSGNATNIQAFDDEMLIVNMSVWESLEHLKKYVYQGNHLSYLRRKAEWFVKMDTPHFCMWWVAQGAIPTPQEARQRLEYLHEHGPSAYAFALATPFAPPDSTP